MLSFLGAIKAKTVAVAASTSIGKNYGIKPNLQKAIMSGHEQIKKAENKIKGIIIIKKEPELKKAVKDLSKQGHALIKELLKDENLDTIADVIGNNIHKYESVSAFKKHVTKKKSFIDMKNFVLTLIDIENYKNLATKMSQLQEFDALSMAEQKKVFGTLQDGKLIDDIIRENSKLDILKIKCDIDIMCKALCDDLELTPEDTTKLIGIFKTLTENHLDELNNIRKIFVKHIPKIVESEKERIQQAHPEFLALQSSKHTDILPVFSEKAEKEISNESFIPTAEDTLSAQEVQKKALAPSKQKLT